MKRIEFYARLYFMKIVPLCIFIAILTVLILFLIGRLNLVTYLNTLFIEAAVALIVAGIFSILSFFNLNLYKYMRSPIESNAGTGQKGLLEKEAKNKTIDERGKTSEIRLEASVFCLIIGTTLLLLLFIIHFTSKLFM